MEVEQESVNAHENTEPVVEAEDSNGSTEGKFERLDDVKYNGFVVTAYHKNNFLDIIENFEVREDDVWVCSFPKTGTTWVQEMVWCIANNLDFERAKVPLDERFPYFEVCTVSDFPWLTKHRPNLPIPVQHSESISFVEQLPSPRFIKTHLAFDLLPRQIRTGEKKPKIVYVVRNAKDACISNYHQAKHSGQHNGNFEDWCNRFLNDEVIHAPFWKHALSYWKKRIDENVLFLKYEDMKKDLPWVLNKTATFLGKNLTTDELTTLVKHLSFESMKANPAVNYDDMLTFFQQLTNSEEKGKFMRNGNTGQWKTDMSPELIERFDNWTRENLKGTRLYF